jgi:hypothetical protein
LPVCGTLLYSPLSLGAKPKPSAPIIAPELMTQLLPITQSEYILVPAKMIVFSPIVTLSPM